MHYYTFTFIIFSIVWGFNNWGLDHIDNAYIRELPRHNTIRYKKRYINHTRCKEKYFSLCNPQRHPVRCHCGIITKCILSTFTKNIWPCYKGIGSYCTRNSNALTYNNRALGEECSVVLDLSQLWPDRQWVPPVAQTACCILMTAGVLRHYPRCILDVASDMVSPEYRYTFRCGSRYAHQRCRIWYVHQMSFKSLKIVFYHSYK